MPRIATSSEGGPGVWASLWRPALATVIALLLTLPATKVIAGAPEIPANIDGASAAEAAMPSSETGPTATVKMNDDTPMYRPASLKIRAGETVEWVNEGSVSHSVVDDPAKADKPDDALLPAGTKPFASGNVMPGGKFRHTFLKPGRYRYFCLSHEIDSMVGEVLVRPLPREDAARVASQLRPQSWQPVGHPEAVSDSDR